jgi:hypothetical protein
MKCSNCGLPLSPSRTMCPRCGTQYSRIYDSPTQYAGQAPMPTGLELSPISDKDQAFFDLSPTMKKQSMPHPIPQNLESSRPPITPPQAMSQMSTPAPLGPFPQVLYNPASSSSMRRTTRIGFTTAGICLIVGALLLTFVSIMAQPLLTVNTVSSQVASLNPGYTALATVYPSSSVVTPTPTPTFPGAQYITNAQMASAIDPITGQATQYATSFSANQKIYVTFSLNTGLQGGAVCLFWYMNSQYTSRYAFAVNASQSYNSYPYDSLYTAGTGYVEVYWATTVACTNKLLAAHVTFTVS